MRMSMALKDRERPILLAKPVEEAQTIACSDTLIELADEDIGVVRVDEVGNQLPDQLTRLIPGQLVAGRGDVQEATIRGEHEEEVTDFFDDALRPVAPFGEVGDGGAAGCGSELDAMAVREGARADGGVAGGLVFRARWEGIGFFFDRGLNGVLLA